MSSTHYKEAWDRYYAWIDESKMEIPWQVTEEEALAGDLAQLEKYFDATKPVLDVGCGTGKHAALLSRHFKTVLGVDVAEAAIRSARMAYPELQFEVLDITDATGVQSFVNSFGTFNVYMRGLLQQITPDDRHAFMENLKIILGEDGVAYLHELSVKARAFFLEKAQGGGLPASMQRVLQQGVTRLYGVDPVELEPLLMANGFGVVSQGTSTIPVRWHDHMEFVPSVWFLINHSGS